MASGRNPKKPNSTTSYLLTFLPGMATAAPLPQSSSSAPSSSTASSESLYSQEAIARALKAASESSPHVYNIINHPTKKLNICVLGCQGEKTVEAQLAVAEHINKIAADRPDLKPDLIILLGDNFYPDGVDSPDDPRFQSHFYTIYNGNTPCLVVLGNHDGGRDNKTHYKKVAQSWISPYAHIKQLDTNTLTKEQAELQQVAHSYLPHPTDPQTCGDKTALFQRDELDYTQLPKHLMPHFYHSWVFDKLQIFGLNSNTYAKDFLSKLKREALHLDDTAIPFNQADWLEMEYHKAKVAGRSTMFTMHHPLFTAGKRHYSSGWDAKHYLNPEEITQLNAILQLAPDAPYFMDNLRFIFSAQLDTASLQKNANYNEMLTRIMCDFQNMQPGIVCTAHDHALYYYNNQLDASSPRKICQMVSGAGGSHDLQDRSFFGEKENVGGFMKEHGFTILSYDPHQPKHIDINVFSTHGGHLHFTNQSSLPLLAPGMSQEMTALRKAVLQACDSYLDFLDSEQRKYNGGFFKTAGSIPVPTFLSQYAFTHQQEDVTRMHELMCYFNDAEPRHYADAATFLSNTMEKIANKYSDHSLYREINFQLNNTHPFYCEITELPGVAPLNNRLVRQSSLEDFVHIPSPRQR